MVGDRLRQCLAGIQTGDGQDGKEGGGMTYHFTHLRKGLTEPSFANIKADSVWEANAKFKAAYPYSIIKAIRVRRGKA